MSSTRRERRMASEVLGRLQGCPDADELQALHAGELDGKREQALRGHVGACGACAAALQVLATTPEVADMPVPAEVVQASEEVLRALAAPETRRSARVAGWLQLAASLLLAAALGVAGYQLVIDRPDDDLGELRGGRVLQLLEPTGSLGEPPVEFRWVAHPSAASYRVDLLDANMKELWVGATTDATPRLVIDEAARGKLTPGSRFTWQVMALDAVDDLIEQSAMAHFEIE